MRISFFIVCLFFSVYTSHAQQDSLFAELKGDSWVIPYETGYGENLFILSKRFHVPPAALADANGLNFQSGIEQGSTIYIPFNKFNQEGARPFDMAAARPVYYVVQPDDNLFALSKYAGVPQHIMQQWNQMPDNMVTDGQVLFAGWVKYDASQQPFPGSKNENGKDSVIVIKMPKAADTVNEAEEEYLRQTNNEQTVAEEKGTIAFFSSSGKVKSSDTYYAFYNGAPKGTIIKVYNPGADKTIFVRVLGALPATKQYHNAIMGLGSVAKDALGVNDSKAWCELKYALP